MNYIIHITGREHEGIRKTVFPYTLALALLPMLRTENPCRSWTQGTHSCHVLLCSQQFSHLIFDGGNKIDIYENEPLMNHSHFNYEAHDVQKQL